MSQLSFFAADVAVPAVADLGGLLAAGGQIARSGSGARLSVLVADDWRASALHAEFARRGLAAHPGAADESVAAGTAEQPGVLVRSDIATALLPLAVAWTRGAVKAVPAFPAAPGGLLRCWALTAGRSDVRGYLLGADRHASHTYPKLAAALAAIGLTCSVIGSRGGGPALRIVGRRRLQRLAELLGDPPPGAPDGAFPGGR